MTLPLSKMNKKLEIGGLIQKVSVKSFLLSGAEVKKTKHFPMRKTYRILLSIGYEYEHRTKKSKAPRTQKGPRRGREINCRSHERLAPQRRRPIL